MAFEILGPVREVQVIASGRGIRVLRRLNRRYGKGRWRKLKGIAFVKTRTNETFEAEIHWYEAHGIGKHEYKIKGPAR
jgi:hypothetical protein